MTTASSSVIEAQVALSPELDGVPGFEALYRQHFGFAWASLRRLGVPNAAIDDAAQDLWVTVHRRLDSYNPRASLKAWIFGIARRVASHYRRSAQRNQRKIAALTVVHSRRSDQPMGRRDVALTVERSLSRLDERKRVAFVLSELEGWSAPEIARVAGTNPNTIYSRIRLAKQQLREDLSDDRELEEAIEDMREETRAPKGAAKHCWAALLPKLGAGSGAATATTFSAALAKLKFAALGAVAGGVALVGVDAALPEPAPVVETPVTVAEPTDEPPRRATPAASKPVRAATAPVQAAIASPVAATPESAPAPVQTPTKRRPGKAAIPVATDPGAPSENAAAELDDEMPMLTQARKALGNGQAKRALELVRQHATRFPGSKLSDLRSVIEVEALCASGSREKARQKAEAFVARHPGAAASAKLKDACPG